MRQHYIISPSSRNTPLWRAQDDKGSGPQVDRRWDTHPSGVGRSAGGFNNQMHLHMSMRPRPPPEVVWAIGFILQNAWSDQVKTTPVYFFMLFFIKMKLSSRLCLTHKRVTQKYRIGSDRDWPILTIFWVGSYLKKWHRRIPNDNDLLLNYICSKCSDVMRQQYSNVESLIS